MLDVSELLDFDTKFLQRYFERSREVTQSDVVYFQNTSIGVIFDEKLYRE